VNFRAKGRELKRLQNSRAPAPEVEDGFVIDDVCIDTLQQMHQVWALATRRSNAGYFV
jgi:hypothetical protein